MYDRMWILFNNFTSQMYVVVSWGLPCIQNGWLSLHVRSIWHFARQSLQVRHCPEEYGHVMVDFESYFILASKLDWEELIYIVFPACLLIPVSYILLIFWANWTCYSDGAHWWLLGCCSNTEAVWSVGELAVVAQWLEHWQLNMNCNPATSVQYKNYSQWLSCFLSACVICYILELYSCTIRCWY